MQAERWLLACLARHGAQAQFVETELDLGVPVDSRVALPAFDGAPGTILLTGRTPDNEKYLALYTVRADGSVEPAPAAKLLLAKDELFFDTGRIDDRSELLLLGPGGVAELKPTGTIELAKVQSIYKTKSSAALTKLDFLVDVNGDGRDDLVVQDFAGLRVAVQSATGFDALQLLQLPPLLTATGTEARYRADRVYCYDFNGDGRTDVAVIRDKAFLGG